MSPFARKSWCYVVGWIILGLLIGVALWFIPTKPDGLFRNDYLAIQGDAFFEVREGNISIITESASYGGGVTTKREPVGVYTSADGRWIMKSVNGKTVGFRATLFYLQFERPDGGSDRYPRVWFARRF
jgi:hypothetical protein